MTLYVHTSYLSGLVRKLPASATLLNVAENYIYIPTARPIENIHTGGNSEIPRLGPLQTVTTNF